jgi:flagellar basal-body rod protein FlgG
MNHSLISSMVSLQTLQQKLDIIANNIANVNTNG